MKNLLMVVVVALLAACSHKDESVSQAPESLVGTYSALDADGKYYARLKVTQ